MIKVSIVGASGYTGGELIRLLTNHPKTDIIGTYGKTTAGKNLVDLHPDLKEIINMKIEEPNYPEIGNESDLVFTSTPHGTAMDFIPEILENGSRVIDLSADYRFDNVEDYEKYYEKHESPELESVYGLPELYREEINDADLVANPGCYPTAAVLSLAPVLKNDLIDSEHIIIDSKSGTSGAGAKPTEKLHFPVCSDNIRPYKVTTHRHSPEITQEATKLLGNSAKVSFTPHLVPMIRGILNTSYVFLKNSETEKELMNIYENFYDSEPFVRVRKNLPQTNSVRGSNFCDVSIRTSKQTNRTSLISAIDNLVKGASGQAIQNMNIMFGFDEDNGLMNMPLRP